jgi:hypothetical protein
MEERLAEIADIRSDEQGLALDQQRLPQRVRARGRRAAREPG